MFLLHLLMMILSHHLNFINLLCHIFLFILFKFISNYPIFILYFLFELPILLDGILDVLQPIFIIILKSLVVSMNTTGLYVTFILEEQIFLLLIDVM